MRSCGGYQDGLVSWPDASIRPIPKETDRLPEFGRVRAARFPGTLPTITTAEVSRLWFPGALIEIEVFAII
jgi:2-iminobutanoate/2-iminopropanoate deaminase